MAVDKKSDYYNPPTNYRDIDGNMKTFTYVDHDKHVTRLKLGRSMKPELYQTPLQNENQQLCEDIISSGAADNQRFIKKFDNTLGKKYGFERYHKGKAITYTHLYRPEKGEDWFKDLRDLYSQTKLTK